MCVYDFCTAIFLNHITEPLHWNVSHHIVSHRLDHGFHHELTLHHEYRSDDYPLRVKFMKYPDFSQVRPGQRPWSGTQEILSACLCFAAANGSLRSSVAFQNSAHQFPYFGTEQWLNTSTKSQSPKHRALMERPQKIELSKTSWHCGHCAQLRRHFRNSIHISFCVDMTNWY